HVRWARTLAPVVHRHPELRRHDRLLPSSFERAAEELLALGRAVDVGGVEEVDARIERRAHHTCGGVIVDAHPEVVAAEADHRHTQRAERTKVHCGSMISGCSQSRPMALISSSARADTCVCAPTPITPRIMAKKQNTPRRRAKPASRRKPEVQTVVTIRTSIGN